SSAAARYLRAQPYTASSTLLFVLVPGGSTVSNHPEVFGGSGPEPGETPAEQGRENTAGHELTVARLGYSTAHVPDVGRMRVPERRDEVGVLAESFNHMLDRLAEAFSSQREFVADASHELRTPLTVIRGQLEVLAAQEHPPEEEVRRVERLVQAEIARLSRMVDDLLLLTQAERVDFLRPEPIRLRAFVAEVWDGLSLTAERRFELGPVPSGSLQGDPHRLAQVLRNLARNAI